MIRFYTGWSDLCTTFNLLSVGMRRWRIEDSEELYNINGWGNGYFSVNEKGHVQVTPRKQGGNSVDLSELMRELYLRDVSAPY